MKDILNAVQAAKVMKCAPQLVRRNIEKGIWTFGRVILPKQSGNKLKRYEINIQRLADYLCITREEAERRLEG